MAPELELEGDEQEFCCMDVPRYPCGSKRQKSMDREGQLGIHVWGKWGAAAAAAGRGDSLLE